jgi:hypothetical protein
MIGRHSKVKGESTSSPASVHIGQKPLSYVNGTVEVGIVLPTSGANKATLGSSFSFHPTDMASSACHVFRSEDNWDSQRFGFVLNHGLQFIERHRGDNSVESFSLLSCGFPYVVQSAKDNTGIGRSSSVDYPFADSVENFIYFSALNVTNPFYVLSQMFFLQPLPEPSIVPSYSSDFPAKKHRLHHNTTLQKHRSCGDALTQIYGKDRRKASVEGYWNFVSEIGKEPSVLFEKFAFAEFPILRNLPMWLERQSQAATDAVNGNLQEVEGLGLLHINQVVSQTQRVFLHFDFLVKAECLLFVGRVERHIFAFKEKLKILVFGVKQFELALRRQNYATADSQSHRC